MNPISQNSTDRSRTFLNNFLLLIVLIFTQFNVNATTNHDSFQVNVTGQGKNIILIPGLMSNGEVWADVAKYLSKKYRVHVISIAGFAGTPKIKNQSMLRVKQEILTYIQQQNLIKPMIIGHSLGGFMAFWMASSSPDKIGAIISVDGLPFVGPVFTRTNETTVESLAAQAKQIKQYYANMTTQQLVAQTQNGIGIQATSDESKKRVLDMVSKSDPKTVGNAIYTLMTTDLRHSISNIKQPSLLIGAAGAFTKENDKVKAKSLYQQQLTLLNSAKLVMNNHSRHFIMFDQPQWLLDQITQFLM